MWDRLAWPGRMVLLHISLGGRLPAQEQAEEPDPCQLPGPGSSAPGLSPSLCRSRPDPQPSSPIAESSLMTGWDVRLHTLVSGWRNGTEAPISPGGTSLSRTVLSPALCPSSPSSDHPHLLPSLHHCEGQALAREGWTSVLPILSQGFGGGQRAQQGEAKQ